MGNGNPHVNPIVFQKIPFLDSAESPLLLVTFLLRGGIGSEALTRSGSSLNLLTRCGHDSK